MWVGWVVIQLKGETAYEVPAIVNLGTPLWEAVLYNTF